MKLQQALVICSIGWALRAFGGESVNQNKERFKDEAGAHTPANLTARELRLFQDLKILAEAGDPDQQEALATLFYDGKDPAEAAKWRRRAAEHGNPSSQCGLAEAYKEGRGVHKNLFEAADWYRRAAEQGYTQAQFSLGQCYTSGEGVRTDYVEAYKWFDLSASDELLGFAYRKSLMALAAFMTSEQIAEGQRLAREFKPRRALQPGDLKVPSELKDSRPFGSGSGFFITDDGFLVTNNHVVSEATQVRLFAGGRTVGAKIVKLDPANDLALLKAEGNFIPLPVTTSKGAKLGNAVATVGFPNTRLQGFAPKLARGEIASLSGAQDDARYFQISAPIQPGNSGGALVDERGNVIGIVSAKLDASAALATTGAMPENVNYAVKSSLLLSFLESVPDVSAKLKEPNLRDLKFEDVVRQAENAAVLVLVY